MKYLLDKYGNKCFLSAPDYAKLVKNGAKIRFNQKRTGFQLNVKVDDKWTTCTLSKYLYGVTLAQLSFKNHDLRDYRRFNVIVDVDKNYRKRRPISSQPIIYKSRIPYPGIYQCFQINFNIGGASLPVICREYTPEYLYSIKQYFDVRNPNHKNFGRKDIITATGNDVRVFVDKHVPRSYRAILEKYIGVDI